MGIKDVIDTVKKPTTLFFDGEYYSSVDELCTACNIQRADYTQVKATHRDWDAMNVVDFLVKSNKGVLPSKNPDHKARVAAAAAEAAVAAAQAAQEKAKAAEEKAKVAEEKVKETEAKAAAAPVAPETPATKEEPKKEEAPAPVVEEKVEEPKVEEVVVEETPAAEAPKVEEPKVEEPKVEVEAPKAVDEPKEKLEDNTKEVVETTMNEYDYTQNAAQPAPAPSGSTAKAFDELLVNLNIAKEGFLVVKQVMSEMSDLDIINAILTTKGNPVGETSKDFDELLKNLNTPKIGFQLVKQIHNDWSDLDVINAIIKSR